MERRGVWVALALLVCAGPTAAAARAPDPSALGSKLAGTDGKEALAAAAALGDARTPAAEGVLLDALALGLPPEVAAAALDAVSRHASDRALPVLLAYARNRNVSVRTHALQALGALAGTPAADGALLAALGDNEHAVRAAAARLLAWKKDARAVPKLLALLAAGDDVAGAPLAALASAEVAAQIVDLAGRAPDAVVAHTLGELLRRRDLGPEALYTSVVRALGAIPGDDALAELQKVVDAPATPRAARRDAQAFVEERRP